MTLCININNKKIWGSDTGNWCFYWSKYAMKRKQWSFQHNTKEAEDPFSDISNDIISEEMSKNGKKMDGPGKNVGERD